MSSDYPNEVPRIDWQAIEADYRAGLMNDGLICAKWGISLANLRRVANKHGWVRQKVEPVNPPPAGGGVPPTFTEDLDVARMQASQILAIMNYHRRDVEKVRALANLLFERTMLVMDGQELGPGRLCFGSRESPADMMLKLAKTMFEAIKMEREILGLRTREAEPDGEANDAGAEWDDVVKKVDEIYKEKVGKAHNDKS